MFKNNCIKCLILIILVVLSKKNFAQIQPWIGFQQLTSTNGVLSTKPQFGISVGIALKDKYIIKYAFTSKTENTDYNIGANSKLTFEDIEKTNMFSLGWILTRPSNRNRVGLGLSCFFKISESNRFENGIYRYGLTNKEWFKGALPFIYFDTRLNDRIGLVFNSLIFINEIGVSYRFGKIVPIKPIDASGNRKKKEIIFH